MDWNSHLPSEPFKVYGSLAAIVVTLVGAGVGLYKLGYEHGKDISASELSARKAVDDAQIPEITKKFMAVNTELHQSLDVFSQNQKLSIEITSYQKQLAEAAKARAEAESAIKGLRDQLQAAASEQSRLQGQIAKLVGESREFNVKGNEAEKLGDGYTVGVTSSSGTTALKVTFNNKFYDLSAGNSLPSFDLEGRPRNTSLLELDAAVWQV